MRPRYPVEVVVQDPAKRDDDGRPTLVFLWLASEEDLRRLEEDVAAGRYKVLNGLEPEALVEDIAMARRKRKPKAAAAAPEGTEGAAAEDYEDVLDEDDEEETGLEEGPLEGPSGASGAEHQENSPE